MTLMSHERARTRKQESAAREERSSSPGCSGPGSAKTRSFRVTFRMALRDSGKTDGTQRENTELAETGPFAVYARLSSSVTAYVGGWRDGYRRRSEESCVGWVHVNENGINDRAARKNVTHKGPTNWVRHALLLVLRRADSCSGDCVDRYRPISGVPIGRSERNLRNRVN